jgi:hypothetical protein
MSGLQDALQGNTKAKDIPDSKKTSMLEDALGQLRSLSGVKEKYKDQIGTVTEAAMVTAELQAANAVGSFAEGYMGREKLQLGPVDGRTLLGTLLSGKGIYDLTRGKKHGQHYLAVGNGLMAAGLGSSAREAGGALKERWAKKEDKKEEVVAQNAAQPVAQPVAQPAAQPAVEGELERMIEGLSRQIASRAIHHRHDPRPRRPQAAPQPAPAPGRRAPANRVPVRVR